MQAWEQFLAYQEKELGKESVTKWLRPLRVVTFDACNLYLEAKDPFQALWFEEHMRQKVQTKLYNNNSKKIRVHLTIANGAPLRRKEKGAGGENLKEKPSFKIHYENIDPTCRFSTFVTSEENALTLKFLGKTVGLDGPAELALCNPIYLHGPSGCGKTHLMMAIQAQLTMLGYKVIYTRAETFTEHVVGAIRASEMSVFRQSYRNCDVLIVDGVHLFAKKGATQEEFFHTFNTLHMSGKQIFLSANCPPSELTGIEPRLVSRFEWGIAFGLEAPSPADSKRILESKMHSLNHPLPAKVVDFLLEAFPRSPKVLMRALEALILRVHLNQPANPLASVHLTPTMARHLLSDLIAEEEKEKLTAKRMVQLVAEQFGIRSDDILGKAQTRECTLPRQLAMYFCRTQLKMPFMQIGDLFEKNHSTVMSSVKLIEKQLESSIPEVLEAHRAIAKKIT